MSRVRSAAGGGSTLTQEQVEDYVGALIADSATLDATYDDASNLESLIVKAASIGTTHLIDGAVTEAKAGFFVPRLYRVAADQSNSTANTGQTALSTSSLEAGTWAYEIVGQYQTSASLPGLRTAITFGGTQTAYNIQAKVDLSTTTLRNDATNDAGTAIGTLIGGGAPSGALNPLPFTVTGTLVVTVAGVLNFQFAPSTANAITIKTGTFMRVTRIS